MDLDEIAYEKADGVAEIVLDRPAQRNPISARPGGTRDQILWALADAEDDPTSGACCCAAQARRSRRVATSPATRRARRRSSTRSSSNGPRPSTRVCATRGSRSSRRCTAICLGAALQLVASCDLVVASEDARFGVPEGRIGLVGAGPLVPIVGRQWAKFLILTGELIDATRAREIGSVFAVEPDDELLERARDLARRLTRLPREASLLNKRNVDAVADAAGDAAGRVADAAHAVITLSNSARATAPDGRTFREIIDTEGVEGMKSARAAQYDTPWLR